MAKYSPRVTSVFEVIKKINQNNLLPIYYFFGEDSFGLNNALNAVEKAVQPLISSDFDKETFYGDEKNLSEVLDFAMAFPFGSEKKLIVFKSFEKVRDKKALKSYLDSPSDFTVIVFIHNGTITNFKSEPFNTLLEKKIIFSAKELKGNNLINWIINFCSTKGKEISAENAQVLIDIAGENRNTIEAQLEKIFNFIGDRNNINLDDINSLSTASKEYNIFNLQDALGAKNKSDSFKIAFKILEQGNEPTYIIYMLTRYFTGLSRVRELTQKKIPDAEAARFVGTHPFYYKNYLKATRIYSNRDLLRISNALINADLTVKTTSAESKSVISILLAEILKEN